VVRCLYAYATRRSRRRHCLFVCPSAAFVRSFFRIDIVTTYLTNGLNNFDKKYITYREYSLAPTVNLVKFESYSHTAVKVARASMSTLHVELNLLVFFPSRYSLQLSTVLSFLSYKTKSLRCH